MNADADFCYLTTTGRISGDPHEIEIWFATRDGETLYLLSGGGDSSDWVRNIKGSGTVTVRIGDDEWAGSARVVTDAEERRAAARLVFEKYQPRYGGDLVEWRERSLPVAITLETS